ncbi:uncharacterized protein [Macrobrachium rosenbergii]|uniref:uncharacterized protein n=1 Tax=Macrobrachium rosenbergii TaxID=79674 RepID=UPI0034D49016
MRFPKTIVFQKTLDFPNILLFKNEAGWLVFKFTWKGSRDRRRAPTFEETRHPKCYPARIYKDGKVPNDDGVRPSCPVCRHDIGNHCKWRRGRSRSTQILLAASSGL